MKKITFKATFVALTLMSITFTQAQSKRATTTENNSSINGQTITYDQLTEENKKFYDSEGLIRCGSVEMNEQRLQKSGKTMSQYNEAFEEWLAPLIEERRARIAQDKANGTYQRATYTIPIIFHVLAPSQGHAADLDAQYINAQIDQLNLDFSNQAGSTNPVAADSDIQFAPATVDPNGNPLSEPGITRHYDPSYSSLDANALDGGVKQATIWDRNRYANIWTAVLGGGLLGYAQFPSNSTLPGMPANGGAATTDGVVCTYTSIGSVANPHPQGGVYAAGRTLTHEIGHWIGLRHIWGDANCGDDYCADTPTQQGSSNGCPTTSTCGTGLDQVQNFMDYSYDTCMDLFTFDQVGRMATVIANADGFDQLINSNTAAPLTPTVVFTSTNSSQAEGSACSYTDITTAVSLSTAATGNTNINFNVAGGTASNNVDFQLMTSSVSFASGATGTRDMTVRVFHDAFVEGDETIQIGLTVTGSDATAGANNTLTLTITDDDVVPSTTQNVTLFSDDFESYTDFSINNIGSWTLIDNDGDATYASDNTNFTNEQYTGSFIVFNPGATTPASNAGWNSYGGNKGFYCFNSNGSVSGTPLNDDMAITPVLANGTNGEIKFWAKSLTDNYNGGERFRVGVSATNDGSGITYVTPNPYVIPPTNPWTEYTYSIPSSFDNQNVYVVIHVVSADEFVFMLDDITVTSDVATPIQTAVNDGTTNDLLNLPGTGTVYTSDSTSGDLMLDITNNDTFNYGCTTSSVFRSGNGAQAYNGSASPNLAMDKVFAIKPSTTNGTNGNTSVKFYFTNAEIQGWLTANPGKTINDIVAYRETVGEIVSLTPAAFGSDHELTGNFTGLDGKFYFGTTETFAKISVSPRVFLQGAMLNNGGGNLMRDDLRVGGFIPTTSPYTDALACNASVFNATGNDAIVDWVFVELRDDVTNTTVVHSQSALLQRDGDVVGVDGTSAITFDSTSRDYYVAIKHRNHLGVMSSTAITLSSTPTTVDFTDANNQITNGTNAQTSFSMPTGVVAMWAGNVSGDTTVRYQGSGNDTNIIKDNVLAEAGNTTNSNLYSYTGYDAADVNLDGTIKYQGSGNDANTLKDVVLAHPNNQSSPSNLFMITEQLP
ncbi:M43 family zinc metalloprotease [Pseudofulvibacter geojedonensis]|uniref:M43 family zinc metalloprotease n=1 Tax=Pseudofulvibacter geojedonensis TaxID=1123758 RepID=A0ABW3I0R8_9FLAO